MLYSTYTEENDENLMVLWPNFCVKGYFMWQFCKEHDFTEFSPGTILQRQYSNMEKGQT